ncbi:conserved protein of unknown function [Methylacidimicrobium sp. AP8]|uniref:DUF1844 domain-containing protein n=1 Tax=Methylacidimicrobium sp. AP8 TaxID=2730359 RepID=UPI0018C1B8BA|nr:DUF1844 domain-containing protein [Methylacidimicrobium sp. AP8]CAB4244264.1 conserved protein of unknown function [Methylacidimicrobium sp. AP8]
MPMDVILSEAEVEARFSRLLQMQIEHVLVLLGRIPLPGGQPMEPRLAEARELIDQLEALEVKTRGNLQPGEKAFLSSALTELRLAYVEASRGKAATPPPLLRRPLRIRPSPPAAPAGDEKRKFFKSYG